MKKLFSLLLLLVSSALLSAAENLITDPAFTRTSGKNAYWRVPGVKDWQADAANGVLTISAGEKKTFTVESAPLKLADPSGKLKLSLEVQADAQPYNWRHNILLNGKYSDNTPINWKDSLIALPKKTGGFQKLEKVFTPAKPVKTLQVKLTFSAIGTVKVRNISVTPFTEKSAEIKLPLQDADNLAPNAALMLTNGQLPRWAVNKNLRKFMTPLAGGGFNVKLPAQQRFNIHSDMIELNQSKPVTIRYGVDFRGKCFPISYFHGILLDKVVYMDGTTESWAATHYIFRHHAEDWSNETTAWTPPKPVKSLRLYFLFKSSADCSFDLKNVFLKQDPAAFSTANSQYNFVGSHTNLVANGNMEIIDNGDLKCWIKFFDHHPLNRSLKNNQLTASFDKVVKHSGNYSMRLSGSVDSLAGMASTVCSYIDFTREYTFSGWMKAENATGNNFLEVQFLRAWSPYGIGSAAGSEITRTYNRTDLIGVWRTPVTNGTHDWKKFSVTMTPPPGTTMVTFRIASYGNKGTLWVDDLMLDGLGNAPAEILVSQLGYPADGVKKAYLRARKELTGSFELLDADNRSVFQSPITPRGLDRLECFNYEADFSKVTADGTYKLKFTTTGGTFTTQPFAIDKDFYKNLIDLSKHFMYHMRCGFDIPGFHRACHLDDGQLRSKRSLLAGGKITGHVDASGGWHDAGDLDKFPLAAQQIVAGFARLGKRFQNAAYEDESAWGIKWYNKLCTPTGVYYNVVRLAPNGQIIIDICPPESETDNIPGNADDRVTTGPGHDIAMPWALSEYALHGQNKELAKKALANSMMVCKDFINTPGKMKSKNFYSVMCTHLVQTLLNYYKLTGEKRYFDDAKSYLTKLVNEVEKNFKDKRFAELGVVKTASYPAAWAAAPMEFAIDYPQDELSVRIKAVFQPLIADMYEHLSNTPLRIIDPFSWVYHGGKKRAGKTGHTSLGNMATGYMMARAAKLYKRREYLDQAENCLYYLTGINAMAASQITGCGWKNVGTWGAVSAVPGASNGTVIKGAVLKGVRLDSGKGRMMKGSLVSGHAEYALSHPEFFPAMPIASDFPMAPSAGVQEIWESLNGAKLRLIEAILDAKTALKR